MHVARLTQDYLGIQPEYRRILVYLKREAPAIFKHGRYYVLLTSGCTGWEPNRAEAFYAMYRSRCTSETWDRAFV